MYIITTKLFSVPPIVFFSSGGEGVPQYKENTEFPSSFSLLGGYYKGQKWKIQNSKVTAWFIGTFGTYNSKEPMVYLQKRPLPLRNYFYSF